MAGPLPLLREICPPVVASTNGVGGNDGYLTAQQYENLRNGAGGRDLSAVSVAALRELSVPASTPTRANLGGYYVEGDGGEGSFYWVPDSLENDDGGLIIKPNNVDTNDPGRWYRFYITGTIYAKWFGAKADGTTHTLLSLGYSTLAAAQVIYPFATALTNEIDWCAVVAAGNKLKEAGGSVTYENRGGTLALGGGVFLCDQPLPFSSTLGFRITGCGKGVVGTGNARNSRSVLVFTGSGSGRFIDFRSSIAPGMESVGVIYTSPTFTGKLIDLSHSTATDTAATVFRDCWFSGGLTIDPATFHANPNTGALCLAYLSNAIDVHFDNCVFSVAREGIRFRDADGSYSNGHSVSACQFVYLMRAATNAGEGVVFDSACLFEGSGGVMDAAYKEMYLDVEAHEACTFTFDAAAKTITRSSGSWITDGFAVGMVPSVFERYTGLNTGTLSAITTLTATVMTMSGATLVNETRTSDCKVYATSTTVGVASPTSEARTALTLTFNGSTITRSAGSWLTDGAYIGQSLIVAGTALNNGDYSRVTSVNATVLSFAANTLTYNAAAKTITRSDGGSFIDDGFQVGQVPISAATSSNNGTLSAITTLTASTITMAGATLVDEASTTADVYVLFETALVARTVASPGESFVAETATTGSVYQFFGGGPVSFIGAWFGDQYVPTPWIQLGSGAALSMMACNIAGGTRVVDAKQGGAGISITNGCRILCSQEPIKTGNTTAMVINGNVISSSAAEIIVQYPGTTTSQIDTGPNTYPAPGTFVETVLRRLASWSMTSTVGFDMLTPSYATDYTTMGLRVKQGGGVGIGLGSTADAGHLQAQGKLLINWLGGNTVLNGFGFGRVQVGYPYHGMPDPPTSLLQINGAPATTIRSLPTNADTNLDEFDSAFEVDASAGNAAGVLPDPSTCKGREYIGIAKDVSGGTASVKTAAGLIKAVGFSAAIYPFAAQWETVKVKSNGTHWIVIT